MGRKKVSSYKLDAEIPIEERIQKILRLFEVNYTIDILRKIEEAAQRQKISYLEFVERLFEEELHKREDSRIIRWTKLAKFPWERKIETFNFNFPTKIDKDAVLELATKMEWLEMGGNVIFLGPPGVGKTHLSIALGLEAIIRGYEVRFISAQSIIDVIATAIAKDKEIGVTGDNQKKLLATFLNLPLLILDDFVYEGVTPEVGKFIFQIVFKRHELKKSIIFTSNVHFSEWNPTLFGDETRKRAAIDRLLQNGTVISINGPSYRIRDNHKTIEVKKK